MRTVVAERSLVPGWLNLEAAIDAELIERIPRAGDAAARLLLAVAEAFTELAAVRDAFEALSPGVAEIDGWHQLLARVTGYDAVEARLELAQQMLEHLVEGAGRFEPVDVDPAFIDPAVLARIDLDPAGGVRP